MENENKNQCPRCFRIFSSQQRLQSHLRRKLPCKYSEFAAPVPEYANENSMIHLAKSQNLTLEPNSQCICEFCGVCFTQKYNLTKHQKYNCKKIKECLLNDSKSIYDLKKTVSLLVEKIAQLEEKPSNTNIVNNNLQVICVNHNDNYLDMLSEQWNDFDKALEYIKDCALSHLIGDCKLIEKIYLEGYNSHKHQFPPSIHYTDKNRTKIAYFNEKKEKMIDNKGIILGKKLANNLQNSYLKGVNHLINENLNNHKCPNKLLEDYDLQTWNSHIYELSDPKYQKKLMSQLNIPNHNPLTTKEF